MLYYPMSLGYGTATNRIFKNYSTIKPLLSRATGLLGPEPMQVSWTPPVGGKLRSVDYTFTALSSAHPTSYIAK